MASREIARTAAGAGLLLAAVWSIGATRAAPPDANSPVRPLDAATDSERASRDAAVSRRFSTLDDYLAYLRDQSRLDRSWYKEIRPGVYELQTGNLRLPDAEKRQRVFTREELEKKYGFAK